jgi:uncharacterized protein YndB with AHSA1/START domain
MISEQELVCDTAANLPGSVVVSVEVSSPVEKVWQSLTESAVASRWFGMLSTDLVTSLSFCHSGGAARLDFGDGDFFDLTSVRLTPPNLIQYDWRFLAMGPCDAITWRIEPSESGSLVTVTDYQPGRSPEACMMLRKGWLDFTSRLVEFHATGKNTRYDWRRELDVGTEINGSIGEVWTFLFAPDVQTQWLPFDSPLESGIQVAVSDKVEPKVLRLDQVAWEPPHQVEFQLGGVRWKQSTTCRIELTARETDTLCYVSHNGWEHISLDQAEQLQQRKRFSALWIEALKRARQITESESRRCA